MIATVGNMKLCAGIPGVIMLDSQGGQYAASAGDYFMFSDDEVLKDANDIPMTLAVQHTYFADPLTGEKLALIVEVADESA